MRSWPLKAGHEGFTVEVDTEVDGKIVVRAIQDGRWRCLLRLTSEQYQCLALVVQAGRNQLEQGR